MRIRVVGGSFPVVIPARPAATTYRYALPLRPTARPLRPTATTYLCYDLPLRPTATTYRPADTPYRYDLPIRAMLLENMFLWAMLALFCSTMLANPNASYNASSAFNAFFHNACYLQCFVSAFRYTSLITPCKRRAMNSLALLQKLYTHSHSPILNHPIVHRRATHDMRG